MGGRPGPRMVAIMDACLAYMRERDAWMLAVDIGEGALGANRGQYPDIYRALTMLHRRGLVARTKTEPVLVRVQEQDGTERAQGAET